MSLAKLVKYMGTLLVIVGGVIKMMMRIVVTMMRGC
jgi:hypothetical protein